MMHYLKAYNCDPEMYKGIQNTILFWTGEMKGQIGIGVSKNIKKWLITKGLKKWPLLF